jgi:hypothetical protein
MVNKSIKIFRVSIPRRISDYKSLLTNLAQTSHYQVVFGSLPVELKTYLLQRSVDPRFVSNDAGLLCFSAQLPGGQLATANISGNYMGIQEKFAHSRLYTQLSLDFYVDKDYKVIKFIEHWIEFIASGSHNPLDTNRPSISQSNPNYMVRMQYPMYYKNNSTKIFKFDRDYKQEIEYTFYGMFPSNLSNIQVSYDSSRTLTASVTFEFDRYIFGKSESLPENRRDDNNKDPKNNFVYNSRIPDSTTAEAIFRNASLGNFPSLKLDTVNFNPKSFDSNTNLGLKQNDVVFFNSPNS